ncbi:ankyrin repeat-containing protein BDA1-like [Neltuma alba]|uniref:ankyrin repeat-containing protein BDA1-like n=1 Tax=Neltuma alba TaxID=207710 RepID=UPI0010A34FAA|nr:ankyrin repeat-containing protein BDA1-like [Prosopis alba]
MDERLVKAARDGDVTTLLNLLEADPVILERACSVHFADSPLHIAALCGKADFVEQIVTRKPSLARETNQQGMIPLHLASLGGHVEKVRELLKAKLDDDGVNQCLLKDEEGWTPLHCASQKGNIMVMEELMSACSQCLGQVTAKGETVLHVAVKANQFEAVKVLADSIKRHNLHILLKAQDQKGKSAYQLAAAKKQYESQVLEVLKEDDEEGDKIREERCINVEGEESESEECRKQESKDSKKMQSKRDDAILIVATLIITLTYQAVADPPSTLIKDGSTKIDWDCLHSSKHTSNIVDLLKSCPAVPEKTNQQGMIPLHLASLGGHVETVRKLLRAKLDDDGVNQCLVKDEEGWTLLHCASQQAK